MNQMNQIRNTDINKWVYTKEKEDEPRREHMVEHRRVDDNSISNKHTTSSGEDTPTISITKEKK